MKKRTVLGIVFCISLVFSSLFYSPADQTADWFSLTPLSSRVACAKTLYGVAVAETEHGTVEASVKLSEPKKTVTIKTVPDEGYVLQSIKVMTQEEVQKDNKEVKVSGKNNQYSFKMPFTAVKILATFEEKPAEYGIEIAKTEHGSVTASTKLSEQNKPISVTATPDEGYLIEAIKVLNQETNTEIKVSGEKGKYSFTMPAAKTKVTVTFAEKPAETAKAETAAKPAEEAKPAEMAKPAEEPAWENPFADVKESDYYYEAVRWANQKGIAVPSGAGDDLYEPEAFCPRAQMVTFLWLAAGSPEPENTPGPFQDVPSGAYYERAVLWALQNGFVYGTSDDTFSPEAEVTRGQAVTFLYRELGKATEGENPFTDVTEDDYYYDAVLWAVANGITSGTGETTFSPDEVCTRAQIITFLYRCSGK